ncbi:hypothetical protein CVIRNUC_001269 [Coccomyxa viridis]|uniref:CCT domain-containing protein n=1 Tax=Coccomyxa viridis TaxID=1274662 RepID=A0AAV1HW11_9CHLO|nr:hypothetical protein CVIRNUC_001269 [Coccomyxa viridis]
MDAQRSASREFSDWHRGSWEADALTSFESAGCGDSTLHCGLTEEDVLAFGLLNDLAPARCAGRDIEISTVKPLQDPQLCRASSDQTSAAPGEVTVYEYQPHAARRDSSCLLEEALSSIGLRQLLPQLSMTQAPVDTYSQMQMSPMSAGYMPFSTGAASVFVPCTNPQPLQDMFKAEPAWGREQELLSTSSMASSGTDGCVPELSHRSLPSIVVKSEACVPDYPASCNGSPCMPPIHSDQGHACAERRMRPRVATLKVDEEYFSSDSEEPLTIDMPAAEGMPLITSDASLTFHRKECLQRYRDKKQRRHFSHKVRYTARKLNADRRPRYKGRFIKAADLSALDVN